MQKFAKVCPSAMGAAYIQCKLRSKPNRTSRQSKHDALANRPIWYTCSHRPSRGHEGHALVDSNSNCMQQNFCQVGLQLCKHELHIRNYCYAVRMHSIQLVRIYLAQMHPATIALYSKRQYQSRQQSKRDSYLSLSATLAQSSQRSSSLDSVHLQERHQNCRP